MLLRISIEEFSKWDGIVKSFKNFDVYYLSSYVKAFSLHGDGEPILFFYKDKNIKAMNVVMKRDIASDIKFLGRLEKDGYYDLTTPYGYGGFLIEGEVTKDSLKRLNDEYILHCKQERIISEFVRFHPVIHNSEHLQYAYDILELGKTITIKLESKEQIWTDLTSKNRNVIRKAQRSGVEIYWGRNTAIYDEFINMYNSTMDKDMADDYYYFKKDFYDSILNDLKYNSTMFYAIYQKRVIAMAIIMHSNKQLHYHLSASDKNFQYLAPTNLLLYEVACWGCENGFNTFHLGGGLGSREDNLYKFKKAFNKSSNTKFAIGKKVIDEDKYKELIDIRRSSDYSFNTETCFFPVYRG